MEERELVKIASDNPTYPGGYYTQFRDSMKPGDVIFGATIPIKHETEPAGAEVPEKPTHRKKVKR